MRRYFVLSLALLLAACASAPRQPVTEAVPAQSTAPTPQAVRSLYGLTPQELVGHFGRPALQIHEGTSMKLQFRGRRCVLDAYLYPSGSSGTLRVTYINTRTVSGSDIDQAACILDLENPS